MQVKPIYLVTKNQSIYNKDIMQLAKSVKTDANNVAISSNLTRKTN